jgi:hypothetical protein
MQNIERRVWREARAMTWREVITKTIAGRIWLEGMDGSELGALTPVEFAQLRTEKVIPLPAGENNQRLYL